MSQTGLSRGSADITSGRSNDAMGRALTERIAGRDEGALANLYDQYAGRAYGLAYRVTGHSQAAEDVVQDAFLWVWEHAERVDGKRGNVGALLLTIVHRRAVDQVRRGKRAGGTEWTGSLQFDPVDDEALRILSKVEEGALITQVREGLATLNAEQRETLEMAYYGGFTHEQIARARDVPLGTVKSRLRLALGKLRRHLRLEEAR